MSGRFRDDPELSLHDLISDPMVRLIMKADGIDERELRELLSQAAAEMKDRPQDSSTTLTADTTLCGTSGPFRRGAGIMLLNSVGHIFVGQRNDVSEVAWQMPQGGIEPGETPQVAAIRELREELGTSQIDIIASTKGWLNYELPQELLDRMPMVQWKGQTQKWFLMRFCGADDEINIATEHPEFSKWQWVPAERLIELIVPFKRQLYSSLLDEFAPYLP